ncbi:hypothetical protein CIB84_010793 [Bambusicola thoracicus]|uniref:CCDC81 HU domain-containing protein n=1 Tax=Bambusicola thoracicus TaxID=9083 RepID=A0A2P4SMY6_BAMTH|nr:hypothetical protein CIB84_010793 [Bambusicola thoracicus]
MRVFIIVQERNIFELSGPGVNIEEIVQIWDQVSLDVQRQLALSKSIEIAGLGTFAVHTRIFDLNYAKRIMPGSTLAVPLDYATIALETSHSLNAVENCVNETVMYLSRCISNGLNVDLVLRDISVLLIRQKKVKMRFYENFLLSLDAAGNLKEIIINRKKGTMNWVISHGGNGVSDVYTEPDILFPSLQLKTEHGKFLLESFCERLTKTLQEKKTKDVFKEEINRKGFGRFCYADGRYHIELTTSQVVLEEDGGDKWKLE